MVEEFGAAFNVPGLHGNAGYFPYFTCYVNPINRAAGRYGTVPENIPRRAKVVVAH